MNTHTMNEIKPVRIQRSRQHKQISPNGLEIKYVGRPSKYGNRYKVVGKEGHWFVLDGETPIATFDTKDSALECCLECYKEDMSHQHNAGKVNIAELEDKNLSCWCSLKEKCHADILLKLCAELANSERHASFTHQTPNTGL